MTLEEEQEFGWDFAQTIIICRMFGATCKEAADFAVNAFFQNGKPIPHARPSKPYTPRYDPALATPRLPDRDWWPLRNAILERDGYQCAYCGDDAGCADHVMPLSRGGSNDPDNLVACCMPCNSSKSDLLLSEWKGRGNGWL